MARTTGDPTVDAALAQLAREDPETADAARLGFESLTAGGGLDVVTAHALADLIWYQIPATWPSTAAERRQVVAGLAALFTRLDRHRYAAMCHSAATAKVLASYDEQGRAAGVRAYRSALSASGVQPPDLPGVFSWGEAMGGEEALAYREVSRALERAIDTGELRPGTSGWRQRARDVAAGFLDGPHDDVTGSSWLQWLHTERLQTWAQSNGPLRHSLADAVADALTNAVPPPETAEPTVAPMAWLLGHAADGAPLTSSGNLARSIVAEGCRTFDWLTMTGNPRSEADILELVTLRELARQMGVVRRSGHRLLLTGAGQQLHEAGAEQLWRATMGSLLATGDAAAAAGELELLLLLEQPRDYQAVTSTVAAGLTEEGWRERGSDTPISAHDSAPLLGELHRRLRLFDLLVRGRGAAGVLHLELTATGRAAALTALRARAVRPRRGPGG